MYGWKPLNWCKTAIPIGVVLGIVTTWELCFWMKYGIQGELAEIPLFYVSISGIMLGIVVGILTVLLAAYSPAKRAAKVSPAKQYPETHKTPQKAIVSG